MVWLLWGGSGGLLRHQLARGHVHRRDSGARGCACARECKDIVRVYGYVSACVCVCVCE